MDLFGAVTHWNMLVLEAVYRVRDVCGCAISARARYLGQVLETECERTTRQSSQKAEANSF